MKLSKREHIALELIKHKDITIFDAYKIADEFIAHGVSSEKTNERAVCINPMFLRPVRDLELNVRVTNALKNQGLVTVGDLVKRREHELKKFPNLGKLALSEIKTVLLSHNLHLGMTDKDVAAQ